MSFNPSAEHMLQEPFMEPTRFRRHRSKKPYSRSLDLTQYSTQEKEALRKVGQGSFQSCSHSHGKGGNVRLSGSAEIHLQHLCAVGWLGEVMHLLDNGAVSASKKLYAQVMSKCGQMKALSVARRLHTHLAERRLELDSYIGGGIVEMYVKCGCLVDAQQVHDKLPRRNAFSWTALISGYANGGQASQALKMYDEMQQEGVKPSTFGFVQALKACISLGDLETGQKIHARMLESGKEEDVFVGTTLVDMYAKCGSMVDARLVFDRLPHRNVVSWTAIILGYAQHEEGEVALQLYAKMQQEGVVPDDRAFVGALKACSSMAGLEEGTEVDGKFVKMLCLEKGRSIHSQVVKGGFEGNIFVGTMLVDMFAKCGSMVDARNVFHKLPHHNVVSWNVMIQGHAERGKNEDAFLLFAEMQDIGLSADSVTFVSILKACGNTGALETGKEIHARICRAGIDASDTMVATALIDMYGKCGSMPDARRVFDALATRDLVTWSALIAGYVRQGESELVFHLFESMNEEGIEPNEVTFLSVLTICSHAGLVQKGKDYFSAMIKKHCIVPIVEHYNCMVDLLSRAGHLDEALAMVEKMPLQPNLVTWMTLLGACRKWTSIELGRHAFQCAVRLDKKHAAAYILMSNIYADAHMWEEGNKIQVMREGAQAWKKPGQSWCTETGGKVHIFVVADTTHPQSISIYAKLEHLHLRLEEEGFLPDGGS